MRNNPDHEKLLADLLAEDDGNLREATLRSGLAALRRKRIARRGAVIGGVVAVVICLFLVRVTHPGGESLTRLARSGSGAIPAPIPVHVIPGTDVRVLSDQELLEVFAGRPVALVGTAGRQKLILFEERARYE